MKKKTRFNRIHFSSKSVKWNTPRDIFDGLNLEYSFNLDPCVPSFTGFKGNGLKEKWTVNNKKGRVFLNPPYKRKITKRWIVKAWKELCLDQAELTVFLLPLRNSEWAKFLRNRGAEQRLCNKRIKFNDDPNGAPFDSMIYILTRQNILDWFKKHGIQP